MEDLTVKLSDFRQISVVMCIYNKDENRVRECLESLNRQTKPCNVVLVDYGSSPYNVEWERSLTDEFNNLTLIEVKRNTEAFNKSRALNIGFKNINTQYVLFTDVDCIFAPNFIEEILKVFKKKSHSIVLCQKIDLDKDGNETGHHEPSASGSCIAIEKSWVDKVHGFDEYYTYWGREDNDLVDRAIRDGYEVNWITDKTKVWHQWHLPATQKTLKENDWYYRKKGKPIIRNLNEWGEI